MAEAPSAGPIGPALRQLPERLGNAPGAGEDRAGVADGAAPEAGPHAVDRPVETKTGGTDRRPRTVGVVTEVERQLQLKAGALFEIAHRDTKEGDFTFGGVVGEGRVRQVGGQLGERQRGGDRARQRG